MKEKHSKTTAKYKNQTVILLKNYILLKITNKNTKLLNIEVL